MDRSLVPPGRIAQVEFGILGTEDVESVSSVNILVDDTLRGSYPVQDGVYDPHMGTTDLCWQCSTCNNTKNKCPGHPGHIKLKAPVISPMFKQEVLQWLKIICFQCGELLLSDKDTNRLNKRVASKRLGFAVELVRAKTGSRGNVITCPKCRYPNGHVAFDKDDPLRIFIEDLGVLSSGQVDRTELFTNEIAHIFSKVSPETLAKVGKMPTVHPSKLILSSILAVPNPTRPNKDQLSSGGKSSPNDITNLLKTIVQNNNILPDVVDNSDEATRCRMLNIGRLYYSMVRSTMAPPSRNSFIDNKKPPISLAMRLPKKKGRFRGTLMGKRVFYSARSVITGDNTLKIDEIGVPISIAKNIQIPEVVQPFNRGKLMVYFNNRTHTYPGCTKIWRRRTNTYHYADLLPKDARLEDGDIVYRNIIDGDNVIFNRQPSLLPSSMSCHKVVVMYEGESIRMNASACNLYNADFDGDQMNIFIALSVKSRAEIGIMSYVGRWFISFQNGSPTIGAFQDGLVGIFLLTQSNVRISKKHAMEMFGDIKWPWAQEKMIFSKPEYTGRELVSMLLPRINFTRRAAFYKPAFAPYVDYDPADIDVKIDRGNLVSGVLDKASCGQSSAGSIFHIIHNEYGSKRALETVHALQQITSKYMALYGFTLGIGDMVIPKTALHDIYVKTSELLAESERITEEFRSGNIIPPLGLSVSEFYEEQQINALRTGDDFIELVLPHMSQSNNFFKVVTCGSKGNINNILAIVSSIGQIQVAGMRIQEDFDLRRTSPYATKYDHDPRMRGFISNSYISGLRLLEVITGAIDAREAISRKALTTSVTGEQNRISTKNLESMIITNDRFVAKNKMLVQFLLGGMGIDPRMQEKVKFKTMDISDAEFERSYHAKASLFDKKFQSKNLQAVLDAEFAQLKQDRIDYRATYLKMENIHPQHLFSIEKYMPINPTRIIADALFNYGERKGLNPLTAVEKIQQLCHDLPKLYMNERVSDDSVPTYMRQATLLLQVLIRSYFNTASIAGKLDDDMLDICIAQIKTRFARALAEYGMSIGILAAMAGSEPLTQFVLDSHHRSGSSVGTKTAKLVRIKELFGAKSTQKMKNPSMVIRVSEDVEVDKEATQTIANHIEVMHIRRFLKAGNRGWTIFFERYGEIVHPEFIKENEMLKMFEKHNPLIPPPNDLINWCIRLEFDRKEFILKNINLEKIITRIRTVFPHLYLVYTSENSPSVVLRVYIQNNMFKSTVDLQQIILLKDKLIDLIVRGVSGIRATNLVQLTKTKSLEDGSLQVQKVYAIQTDGTNLREMIKNKYINHKSLHSDSIQEVRQLYGIEAARKLILNELRMLIPGVSYEHYSLYADEMTYTGRITSIDRDGLNRREGQNVLLRASLSHPVQVLQEAAFNSRVDPVYGISAPLSLGQIPRVGTYYNELCLNEEFVSKQSKPVQDLLDDI